MIDFETIMTIDRKGKRIAFYLEKGVHFTVDNLVDITIHELSPEPTNNLSKPTKLVEVTNG